MNANAIWGTEKSVADPIQGPGKTGNFFTRKFKTVCGERKCDLGLPFRPTFKKCHFQKRWHSQVLNAARFRGVQKRVPPCGCGILWSRFGIPPGRQLPRSHAALAGARVGYEFPQNAPIPSLCCDFCANLIVEVRPFFWERVKIFTLSQKKGRTSTMRFAQKSQQRLGMGVEFENSYPPNRVSRRCRRTW
jgi:hypothetical protein